MPKIHIEINQQVDFNIEIYNDPISKIFYQQHVELMNRQPDSAHAVIVDATKYSISYFLELIQQAKETNTVDWSKYDIKFGPENYAKNQQQFNDMHKDLEIIDQVYNYQGLSDQQRDLLNEMHCCLHTLEKDSAPLHYQFDTRTWLLFNYYADLQKTLMPGPVKFVRSIRPGQVVLDYCYVGKEPLVCAMHHDNVNLPQTCKIVDRVSASWKLYTGKDCCQAWLPQMPEDVDATLTKWYIENQETLSSMGYSLQQVIDHTGFYVVGEIDDHSVFEYLNKTPNIVVTNYKLIH